MPIQSPNRDIVVVGASAGGLEALSNLVAGLPPDFPATILVVLHTHPTYGGLLPDILNRRGPLRATHAEHGEPLERGRIYVAPPDDHLTVRPGQLEVLRGPKENGQRPSIDALFRSAAQAYGPRVIGVVLSGFLDCGTSGLLSIQARRGVCVVQDPDEAAAPEMPRNATLFVEVDHVVPIRELAGLLVRLTWEPAPEPSFHVPREIRQLEGEELGVSAEVVCPLCQGRMTEATVGRFHLLRCHTGHTFTEGSLVTQQAEELERALWAAVRALEESAALARRVARSTTEEWRERLVEKEKSQLQQAEVIKRMLLEGQHLTQRDERAKTSPAAQEADGHY